MSNKVALHLGPLRDSGTRDSPDKIAASFSQCTSLPSTSSSFPNHSHFSQSLSQLLHINALSTMSIMLDALVRCRTPGCNRLIEDAVPLPQSSRARLPNSKAHKHCSLSCARRDLSLRVKPKTVQHWFATSSRTSQASESLRMTSTRRGTAQAFALDTRSAMCAQCLSRSSSTYLIMITMP
jgi:hypothetical protein